MRLSITGTAEALGGEVEVPNSKYHAHRALILASLAPGTSTIVGLSDARHVAYTVELLRGLGVRVLVHDGTFVIEGGQYHPVQDEVTAGSSGSTLYFMIGLACLADAPVTITGQQYFQRRPVAPLLAALRQMGVHAESPTGAPPIRVHPGRPTGGTVRIPGTLSQWVSGLLMLAPMATGPTVIEIDGEPNERPYLQLTVDMMKQFGLQVEVSHGWRRFDIAPGQQPQPTTLTLPPDIGSAAFGIAAGALHPSNILLRGLTETAVSATDHPEAEILDIAGRMGVSLTMDEQAGAVRVRHDGSPLHPVTVDCRDIPDALPVLTTMAAFADGTSVFDNIAHVRLKESDRASAMLQLNRMGADLELDGDRLLVRGGRRLTGSPVSSFNDHRVLMSLAVAASAADGTSTITYPNAYRISYPTFLEAMNILGIDMHTESEPRAARSSDRPPTGRTAHPTAHTPGARRTGDATATGEATVPGEATVRPLSDWAQRWAIERPHDTAVIDVRADAMTEYSWREVIEAADQLSAALLDLGVARGERVAFQLANSFEFVVTSIAVSQIDAVCCPLMPIFREREVSFALRRSQARVLIIPDVFRGRDYRQEAAAVIAEGSQEDNAAGPLVLEHVIVVPSPEATGDIARGGAVRWHHYPELLAGARVSVDQLIARRPSLDSTAQLLFTSGTSGEPKGVLHTHRVLTTAAQMQADHLGLTGDDHIYIPSPLAHQTGFLYGMWLAVTLGAPQSVQAVWSSGVALRVLRDKKCTFVQAATPFLADLVQAVEDGDRPPTALRMFVATGAAVPRGLAERATRLLDTAVCGAWGTTETCLGTLSAPTDEPVKAWGTDGRALDGIEIRITDDDGHVLGPNTEGNFEVRGPTFFTGYLDRPDWTAAAFTPDGYFRTGDLGIIDDSGYIRITGRVRDVINRGGEKIPVSEIEQLLYAHPAVSEVAIVAMPDTRLGERACAFVVPTRHSHLEFEAMQKYLDSHQVSKHYWPERLEIIDAMPRNPAGKIQKFALRDRARSLQPSGERTPH